VPKLSQDPSRDLKLHCNIPPGDYLPVHPTRFIKSWNLRNSWRKSRDRRRTRPDRKSGRPIWPRAVFTLTCTLTYTITKTPDSPVLRDKQESKPRPGSTGGTPCQKISKALILATQNPSLDVLRKREWSV